MKPNMNLSPEVKSAVSEMVTEFKEVENKKELKHKKAKDIINGMKENIDAYKKGKEELKKGVND